MVCTDSAPGDRWAEALSQKLDARREARLYRRRALLHGPQAAELCIDGEKRLAFCSNDYLGLADHPEVRKALSEALSDHGVGSAASHLVVGHSSVHHALEEALAEFLGRERALLFSTGYMANVGTISALLGRGDAVLADRHVHASLLDGAVLSRARLHRYAHGRVEQLESRLQTSKATHKLVITDGVFSMDGDLAPLPALAACCARHDAWLMVDDAHGIGVLGADGGGTLAHYGMGAAEVPVLVGTLGKAFGTFGAFVAGENLLIEALIQYARPYIYTTALPPVLAAASLASLEIIRAEPWRRRRLRDLVARFRHGAAALNLPLAASDTPIQPVILGDADAVLRASDGLAERGIHVTAIRPPTVPKGRARLRLTFTANHTLAHVDRLLQALSEVLDAGAISPLVGDA
jgi:8-amino-7-oxononanoate synthase